MTDSLIANLRSLLTLPARPGWILLIIGGTMIYLVNTDVIPRADIAADWIAAFWLVGVIGAAILLVSLGSSIWQIMEAARKERKAEAERKEMERNAVAIAAILRGHEAGMLMRILESGNKQFVGNDIYHSLSRKSIIRRWHPGSDVFEVVDSVWSERERLISILHEAAHFR